MIIAIIVGFCFIYKIERKNNKRKIEIREKIERRKSIILNIFERIAMNDYIKDTVSIKRTIKDFSKGFYKELINGKTSWYYLMDIIKDFNDISICFILSTDRNSCYVFDMGGKFIKYINFKNLLEKERIDNMLSTQEKIDDIWSTHLIDFMKNHKQEIRRKKLVRVLEN